MASDVVFTTDDVARFAAASGDVNPLHTSDGYAHRTPYGRPVVHGALVAVACLAPLCRPEEALTHISVEFLQPAFCDTPYTVDGTPAGEVRTAALFDGSVALARVTAEAKRVDDSDRANLLGDLDARFARTEPRDFEPDGELDDAWFPVLQPLRELTSRFDVAVPIDQVAALAWCSYLSGMELPGRQALLRHLDLAFRPAPSSGGPFGVRARMDRFDPRFDLMTVTGELELGSSPYATANLVALVRPTSRTAPAPAPAPSGETTNDLEGHTAVVVGASRGLGAAVVEALASRSATVIGTYRRDAAAADALAARLATVPGTVRLLSVDAGDRDAVARLASEAGGAIDSLICCASPAFQPLRIEAAHLDRILDHLGEAVRTVAVSLAAFLPALSARAGRVVVISSSVVSRPVATWPHYVAAKQAVEGLVQVAALEYPDVRFLVKRPPLLDTDLAASPAALVPPLAPEVVAEDIAGWLAAPAAEARLTVD